MGFFIRLHPIVARLPIGATCIFVVGLGADETTEVVKVYCDIVISDWNLPKA